MRYALRSVLAVILSAISANVAVAQTTTTGATTPATTRPAPPLNARDGIRNFVAKLKAGRDVTIVFFGGPITASGGPRGYASLVVRWLGSQFPDAHLRLVNAGLVDGGTPLGAARFERDVTPNKPDLLFVEFAADDAGKDERTSQIERIVRKAWMADPTTDIMMLYAVTQDQRETYAAGKLPPATAAYEKVAEYYGIPSVTMGAELFAQIEAGKARWIDYFYDAARPKPAGYSTYADAVIASLQKLIADAPPAPAGAAPTAHALKTPINPNLVLRPTSRPAATMPATQPMTDETGAVARETYWLPLIGTYWVGSPEYADANGRILWRLLSQSARDNGRRMNESFGLDRSKWGPPMQWFEEWAQFTGPSGVYLASNNRATRLNNLTARENDLPILTFTAPHAGRYIVRVRAGGVMTWGLHAVLAMNVVHFPKGEPKGTSVGFHRTQRGAAEPPNINADVRMNEGDDIAIELDTNATGGGGGAGYRDLEISVGWFGE